MSFAGTAVQAPQSGAFTGKAVETGGFASQERADYKMRLRQ